MWRKILAAAPVVAFGVGAVGAAAAASAPTLGPVTIIKAGQRTPVDIAGNALHQGGVIRKATQLRRWLVTMHGASRANVTLACGASGRTLGLGLQEKAKVAFALAKGSAYGHRTIGVYFYTAPVVSATGARASVYLLCATG